MNKKYILDNGYFYKIVMNHISYDSSLEIDSKGATIEDKIIFIEHETEIITYLYLITDQSTFEKFTDILRKHTTIHEISNITDPIIKSTYNDEFFEELFIKSDYGRGMIEYFRKTNINIDVILDKISECGIDSLTEYEKNYLDTGEMSIDMTSSFFTTRH